MVVVDIEEFVAVLNIYIKYRVAVEREGEKECAAIFKIHFLPSY